MPFALATASAPARTARATGLPALLVKMPRDSACAGLLAHQTRVAITVVNQAPRTFIVNSRLPAAHQKYELPWTEASGHRPLVARSGRGWMPWEASGWRWHSPSDDSQMFP